MKHVAIYVRVSTAKQETKSQEPDLQNWEKSQDEKVVWYRDKASGKTMNRPAWEKLEREIRSGKVSKVVVWRIDRLGRTAGGLVNLFEMLTERGVGLVSLRDGLDLGTPAGRLMAHVLASVAAYETEVRAERIKAGIEVAKAQGKKWGGSEKGVRKKVTPEKERTIKRLREEGVSISKIAKTVGLSRPTVYSVLG